MEEAEHLHCVARRKVTPAATYPQDVHAYTASALPSPLAAGLAAELDWQSF